MGTNVILVRNKKSLLIVSTAFPVLLPMILAFLFAATTADKGLQWPVTEYESMVRADEIGDVLQLSPQLWRQQNGNKLRYPGPDDVYSWLRVTVPVSTQAQDPDFVADVEFILHKSVDFYLVERGRVIDEVAAGFDRVDTKRRSLGTTSAFAFKASPEVERYVYVKTVTAGQSPATLKIRTNSEFIKYSRTRELCLGLMLGTALGMVLFNLFLFVFVRRKIFLYYSIFLASLLAVALLLSGSLGLLYPPIGHHYRHFLLFGQEAFLLTIAAVILFQKSFFRMSNHLRILKIQDRFSLGGVLALALLAPFVNAQLHTLVIIFITSCILVWKQLVLRRYLRHPQALQFFMLILGFSSSWFVTYAAWFGWIEATFVRNYMFQIGALIVSAVFSSSLAIRLRLLEKKRQKIIASLTKKRSVGDGDPAVTAGSSVDDFGEVSEVCIMFVDIVSFSQISAPLPSRKVFNELSRRISQIGSVVEAHGGAVDRSLGDGLLCFFASEDADEPEKNTMNAFLAASKIQELTVSQANSAAAAGRDVMIMPVRIGIHSAEVSVGNLGGQTLVDFTMVGSGVNFARRLQTACSPFKMIVSKLCRDQLVKAGVSPALFSDIAIAVKHHANLVQACECDPFYERPHLLKVAETFHLDQLGVRAFDKSVDVEDPSAINLVSSYGTFVVVDLSMFGFRVTGPRLFGQKSLISVKIVTSDAELNRKLQAKLMDGVTVEVRWGKVIRSGFEHGLKIYGGNKGQRQFLYDLLRERYGAPRNNLAADQIIRDIA